MHEKVWDILQQIENTMKEKLPDQEIKLSKGYTSSDLSRFVYVCETKKKEMHIAFIIECFKNQKISLATMVKDNRPDKEFGSSTFGTYDELKYVFNREKENISIPYYMFIHSFQVEINETFRLESLLKDDFLENKTKHLVPYLQ